ncbi:MAG: DUF2723 domain-containing protein [Myxococcales bacterium]|nr:DUF2723 domain-containing protein [Myxococcales bacterium]
MAAPGFFWLDSAELSAAGIGLGAPHPSGFPLYMMLSKAASLVPVGELAFRINLLSVACAAYAIGGCARLVLVLGRDDWATIAGAAGTAGALCFSFLFARQATVAEVYAPTAALIVLTMSLFERVASGSNAGAGLSLAWVAGLGFALHPEYRMLMGLPIVALLCLRAYRGARWPLLAPSFAIFSAVATYLYLPIRSATGRINALDWGHTETLSKTWAHASGAEVRKVFDERMMSTVGEIVRHDVSTFAKQILDHLGVVAVLAGFVGLVVLLIERRTRWVGVVLAVIIVLDAVYASWINPMGLVDLQNGVPMVLGLSICAGAAISALARSAGIAAPFVGGVVALIVVMPPALSTMSTLGLVGDLPRDFSESALTKAPVSALVLSQGDSLAAGTSYMQSIEGARPDVGCLVVPMLADKERVAYILESTSPKRAGIGVEGAGGSANPGATNLWSSGRPMLWEPGPVAPPSNAPLMHGVVVGQVASPGKGAPPSAEVLASLAELYAGPAANDLSARRVLASSLTNFGRSALAYGKTTLAEQLFKTALEVRPGHAVALVNLGVIYSRSGELKRAVLASEQALRSEPNRVQALVNAARYHLALGNLDKAERHAARTLIVSPRAAASWTMAGLVDMKSGKRERARDRLQKALVLSPGHREAREALTALQAGQ